METPAILIPHLLCSRVLPAAKFPFKAKSRPAARLILSSALLLISAAVIAAQQPLSLADAAQQGEAMFRQSDATGMVLVVVRNREVMIRGYGETYPGSAHAPSSTSLLRLCSLSKVFTADLLMKLASEGKLGLTDPLQQYAPPEIVVPKGADDAPITLQDLATHTAGLPREVSAYPRKTPHFTFPDYDLRWDWLPKQQLITPPGTAALYSNIGFDLLGDALSSAAHQSYAHLLHNTLLQPLGMWDTTLVPSVDQCSRLLRGANDEGPCTDTQPSGASGGLYSTPADMARFLRYLLHTPGSPAQPVASLAVYRMPKQLTSMQGLSHAGNPTGIGLAWIQIGDPGAPNMEMEKTGGGAGFTTYIALNPNRQVGVFLAITEGNGHGHIDFFHESNNLLAALANVPPLPPKMHRARAVHPARAAARHAKPNRRPHASPASRSSK